MSELKQKAIKAAGAFLTRRGYEVLETEWRSEDGGSIDVVARDEDAIVFCDVEARSGIEKGMPGEGGEGARERMEINAARWLSEHGDDPDNVDTTIRFDHISMLVVGEDRALLRHHINCLGSDLTASSAD